MRSTSSSRGVREQQRWQQPSQQLLPCKAARRPRGQAWLGAARSRGGRGQQGCTVGDGADAVEDDAVQGADVAVGERELLQGKAAGSGNGAVPPPAAEERNKACEGCHCGELTWL